MSTFQGTPIPLGQVQATYNDQMASALEGMLANQSDINLTDSMLVNEADGIVCGRGVVETINTTAVRPGVNDVSIALPTGSTTAGLLAGIVVRPFTPMSTLADDARILDNRAAMVLSTARIGGRIWIRAYGGCTAGATAFWRVGSAATGNATPVGAFCGAAITSVTPATSATGTVINSAVPADASTLKVGAITYRFKGTMAQAEDIKLEATLDATMAHLLLALNGGGTEGVDYFAGTTTQEAVVLAVYNSPTLTITSVVAGTAGNSIALVETGTTMIVSGATLLGGAAASTATDTVSVTNVKWRTTATSGNLALAQITPA
jgi:hypothetical protein